MEGILTAFLLLAPNDAHLEALLALLTVDQSPCQMHGHGFKTQYWALHLYILGFGLNPTETGIGHGLMAKTFSHRAICRDGGTMVDPGPDPSL